MMSIKPAFYFLCATENDITARPVCTGISNARHNSSATQCNSWTAAQCQNIGSVAKHCGPLKLSRFQCRLRYNWYQSNACKAAPVKRKVVKGGFGVEAELCSRSALLWWAEGVPSTMDLMGEKGSLPRRTPLYCHPTTLIKYKHWKWSNTNTNTKYK